MIIHDIFNLCMSWYHDVILSSSSLLTTVLTSYNHHNDQCFPSCPSLSSCSLCMSNPSCVWCPALSYNSSRSFKDDDRDCYDCDDDDDQRCSSREESVCPTNPIDNGNTMQVAHCHQNHHHHDRKQKEVLFLILQCKYHANVNRWARTNPSPQNPTKTTMFRFSLRFAFWKFLLRDASLTLMTLITYLGEKYLQAVSLDLRPGTTGRIQFKVVHNNSF